MTRMDYDPRVRHLIPVEEPYRWDFYTEEDYLFAKKQYDEGDEDYDV